MEDGSIRVAEVTEDSLGTYTCMPYNALGSMGWSTPAPLVLKVHSHSKTSLRRMSTSSVFTFLTQPPLLLCFPLDRTLPNSQWFLEGSTDRRPGESWSSPVRRRETLFPTSHGERSDLLLHLSTTKCSESSCFTV